MHREVMRRMGPGKGLVDHHDTDGLNNARENLRWASYSENGGNARRRRDNRSGFKGVDFHNGKWRARIRKDTVCYHLGHFGSARTAARVYDAAARELFGEFARVNFPLELAA